MAVIFMGLLMILVGLLSGDSMHTDSSSEDQNIFNYTSDDDYHEHHHASGHHDSDCHGDQS